MKHSRHQVGVMAMAIALAATGCSVRQADTTSSPVGDVSVSIVRDGADTGENSGTSGTSDTSDTEVDENFEVEVLAVRQHPNGVQAQVNKLTFASDATTVTVRYVNGREFDTTLRGGTTALIDAAGKELSIEPDSVELPEATTIDVDYAFPAVDIDDGPFTVLLYQDNDDEGLDESTPSFALGPIDVKNPVVPDLPMGVGLADTVVEGGAQIQIAGIGFSETHIGVAATLVNNATSRVNFANGRYATYLDDDLGNRYPLELGAELYFLRVDDGDSVTGTLVFSGRVDPAATSLTLVTNGDSNSGSNPRLEAGPYSLDGDNAVASELLPIVATESYEHPNGATIGIGGISFTADSTSVAISVENNRAVPIRLRLGDTTFVTDDLGNRYGLLPPADNDSVEIAADTLFDGTLSFPGVIDPAASSITVMINAGRDAERDPARSGFPEALFGPYPLQRGASSVGSPPETVGTVSDFSTAALTRSDGEAAQLIFDEFNGVEVPGGVLLTLPESILFASGEARLASASRAAIDKVILIMEFYAGDQVNILGHTDDEGSDDYNLDLSVQRADAVVAALVAAGADPVLVSGQGRGEAEPVADNTTADGRQANRRVEIMVQTDKGLPG